MSERKPRPSKPQEPKTSPRQSRPALDPESREKQLTALAVDLAERQLRDGTAAPSVINHFLKLASTRENLEREILEKQAKLIESKAKKIELDGDNENAAKKAIEAMKRYTSGS